MCRFDASLIFVNCESFSTFVLSMIESRSTKSAAGAPTPVTVIIDATPVNSVDFSGLEMLADLSNELKPKGHSLVVANLKNVVADSLELARIPIPRHHSIQEALDTIRAVPIASAAAPAAAN